MNVFDAPAPLAFLQGEEGSAAVGEGLSNGGACGTANWSEVAQKIRAHGRDWPLARALLVSYGLQLKAVTVADAEEAATTWTRGTGMSLGDRLCLALGQRLGANGMDGGQQLGSERNHPADLLTGTATSAGVLPIAGM